MTALDDRPALVGKATPRLSTAPLVTGPPGPCGCGCALTPATSLGFEAIAFAEDVLGVTLLSWQRWWLIHALETRPDGSYRFRTILTLVGRQQGKTTLLKIVALWAMFLGRAHLVLGAAQSLDIARESWAGACELAESTPDLAAEVDSVRRANGEQTLTLVNGARYRISAATRSAGRGLSVDLLILDELREHRDSLAWAALSKTTIARPNALIVGISNAGDDESIVLNTLRSAALSGSDDQLGIFEWSAPDGCALDDRAGWAQAMPGLGATITESAVRTSLVTDPPNVFRTELLCQHVSALDNAVDPASWRACADPGGSLAAARDRVAVCIDVSADGSHVTACAAAALSDGRVRVEALDAWRSTEEARAALDELIAQVRPLDIGWFPGGPAAALGAELRALRRHVRLPRARITGRGMEREVVTDEEHEATRLGGAVVLEACQGFADLVASRRLTHPDDQLINAHVLGARKLRQGEGWRFVRDGSGNVDAAYAAAGAVYLARRTPVPAAVPRSRIF